MSYTPDEFPPVPGLRLAPLTDERVAQRIRVIDKYCLPVTYGDSYYHKYVEKGLHAFNQLAFYHDILVGSITCRLEKEEDSDDIFLYIMTICVLEAYRGLGLGKRLLARVLDEVHHYTAHPITCVRLHMQVGSPVASFYAKYGFEVEKTVTDYYTDLDERNALLMRRVIPQPHVANKKKGGK